MDERIGNVSGLIVSKKKLVSYLRIMTHHQFPACARLQT